jgi:hypothetical protein
VKIERMRSDVRPMLYGKIVGVLKERMSGSGISRNLTSPSRRSNLHQMEEA